MRVKMRAKLEKNWLLMKLDRESTENAKAIELRKMY